MPLTIVTRDAWSELLRRVRGWEPRSRLGEVVRRCLGYLPPELAGELLEAVASALVIESSLSLTVYRACPRCGRPTAPTASERCRCPGPAPVEELGVVSHRVITNAGVAYLVRAWRDLEELERMRCHAIGTGTTAESSGNTALAAEITAAQYQGGARALGTLEAGPSSNVLRTVGVNVVTASLSITEHGLFDTTTVGQGTLWDRSVFAAVNLAAGDGLKSTYDMTASAGG